jgi:hypothetical protein
MAASGDQQCDDLRLHVHPYRGLKAPCRMKQAACQRTECNEFSYLREILLPLA